MDDHVHMGILWILSVGAAVAVVNVTTRTVAAHTGTSSRPLVQAFGKGLTYVFG